MKSMRDTIMKMCTCFCLAVILVDAHAQNMNNPYSVYGIGDIDYKSYNRTNGMAGTGLALRSSSYIINNNPASITGLERSFLVASIAATGKSSTYQGTPINTSNTTNRDFWVKGVSIGTKINKFWASNIGLGQFSNVNYKFTGTKAMEGSSNTYTTLQEGDGGLNEFYWVNAVSIGKHLSVGVRSSWLSGSINQTETLYDPNLLTTIATKQQDYFSNLRFQYGALYARSLSKKWDLSVGGRYAAKTRLAATRSLTVTQDGELIVDDAFIKKDRFNLPATYGAGIALTYDKRTIFAADYTYENWSAMKVRGNGWRLINSHRLSAGVEFARLVQQVNRPVEKKFVQLGAHIGNSYLQVKGKPVTGYGFTLGTGGVLGYNLLYTLSGEFGVRGTTDMNMIRENYFQFTFSLSLREFLFSKGRRYY
jgi:hypothetical protein